MLKAKGLPGWFWGEAVSTAVYLLNICPMKSVDGMMPFKAWHGKKPAVHHLKTFGCIVYVRNTAPHLKTFGYIVYVRLHHGYERGSKAYRAYDPITKRVHMTRDVVFDEQAQWDWGTSGNDDEPSGGNDMFTVQYATMEQAIPEADDAVKALGGEELGEQSPLPDAGGGEAEPGSPVGIDDDNLDADHDDNAPLRFRSINDRRGFARRTLVMEELHAVSANEPASFAEAEHSSHWRRAMMEEMESIEENGTWSLADLPPGPKAIGVKWAFKVKRDEHGVVSKHKARLVVKGYAQWNGIDYD